MGIALAVFVLAMVMGGLSLLAVVPLLFAWLALAVYREPWVSPVTAAEPGGLKVDVPPAPPEPEAEAERPKVMTAGRRRPL